MQDRFWPALFGRVRDLPEPPVGWLGALGATTEPPADDARRWLTEALAVPTSNDDAHPSLRDRLRAMEKMDDMTLPPPVVHTASAWLFEEREAELVGRTEAWWRDAIARSWAAQHQAALLERRNADAIAARAAITGVTTNEEWVALVAILEPGVDGRLVDFAARHPEHALAQYELGQRRLDHGDDRGIQLLERAMALDRTLIPAACGMLQTYLDRKGHVAEAKQYQARAFDQVEVLRRASTERRHLDHTAPLAPHGLSVTAIEQLRDRLAGFPRVRSADLARLAVEHLPDRPYFILGITLDSSRGEHLAGTVDPAVMLAIESFLGTGADLYPFIVRTEHRVLARRIAAMPGARIYEKARRQ
jgi:hypothetical protein